MERSFTRGWMAVLFFSLGLVARGAGNDPFTVEARVLAGSSEVGFELVVSVPEFHFLYDDQFHVSVSGAHASTVTVARAHEKTDPFSGELKQVFDASFTNRYRLSEIMGPVHVRIQYQGCDREMCFFPQKKDIALAIGADCPAATVSPDSVPPAPAVEAQEWARLVDRFTLAGTASGFMKVDPFLRFLGGQSSAGESGTASRGMAVTLLLILIGGLALNLTPCVLPLVPINLAILGAGTRAASRRQGFLLGGLYGAAIALVYGILGLTVVLFGAKFGALNASITFNIVIAVIFLLMALAMFDVITVDFSSLHSSAPGKIGTTGRYWAAFIAGGVSALLAGACVAPAVISTLLLSAQLYAEGNPSAALLPFLLGLGMALPWPFAGAGLSVLPKPGAWMVRVKQGMGVLILVMAGYYAWIGWSIARARSEDTATRSVAELTRALNASVKDGRPVFIDFWATWCKNCEAMEVSTFQDPAVRKAFEGMHVVKFQAEQPDVSPAREVLDHFRAVGLPTYIILKPKP